MKEQALEQEGARESVPPEIVERYRDHRFAGNVADGPRVVPKEQYAPLNDWAAWLEREGLPPLCDIPIGQSDDRGSVFFWLPSLKPPTDLPACQNARAYLVAAIDEQAAEMAAQ